MERYLSRREFNRDYLLPYGVSGLFTIVRSGSALDILAAKREKESYQEYREKLDWFINPNEYSIKFKYELPEIFKGRTIIPNSPFLWKTSDEVQDHFIDLLSNSTGRRIFISDELENSLGDYDTSILPQVIQFCEKLRIKNQIAVIDVIDANMMRYNRNITWGSFPPSSVYAKHGEFSIYDNNSPENKSYINRLRYVINGTRHLDNIVISLGNEFRPQKRDRDREEYYNFHERVAAIARNEFPDVTLVTGNRDPRYFKRPVKGLDAISAHIYTGIDGVNPWNIGECIKEAKMPVIIQEIGHSNAIQLREILLLEQIAGKDEVTAWMIFRTLLEGSMITKKKGLVKEVELLFYPSFGPWKSDKYDDGFDFTEADFPLTNAVLNRLTKILN